MVENLNLGFLYGTLKKAKKNFLTQWIAIIPVGIGINILDYEYLDTIKTRNRETRVRNFLEPVRWWYSARDRKSGDVNNVKSLSAVKSSSSL